MLNYQNSRLRYQTVHSGGVRANKPLGLITGIPADVFTKYVSGSGVGSTSTFARRAKLRRAIVCKSGCGNFIYPIDQPNANVNGRYTGLKPYVPANSSNSNSSDSGNLSGNPIGNSIGNPNSEFLTIAASDISLADPFNVELTLTQTNIISIISTNFNLHVLPPPGPVSDGIIVTTYMMSFNLQFPNLTYSETMKLSGSGFISSDFLIPLTIRISPSRETGTVITFITDGSPVTGYYSGQFNIVIEK